MGRCMKSGAVETRNLSGKTFFIGRSWKWAFETRQQDLTPWSAFRTLEFSTCALRGKGSSPESGQSPAREQLPDAIQGSNSQWDFSRHQFTAVIASRGSLLLHQRARCHDAAREHLLQAATRAQAKKVKGEAVSSPVCNPKHSEQGHKVAQFEDARQATSHYQVTDRRAWEPCLNAPQSLCSCRSRAIFPLAIQATSGTEAAGPGPERRAWTAGRDGRGPRAQGWAQALRLPFHGRISTTDAKDARSTGQLDQGRTFCCVATAVNVQVALLFRRQDPASEARDD